MSRAPPPSPSKRDAAAAVGDNEDAEDQMLEEDTNDASSQQQVPAFQDYCMLRVFVSWPPPPADCDASLHNMWYARTHAPHSARSCCLLLRGVSSSLQRSCRYKKPLSKLKMEPLRLVAQALPGLRKEMLWYCPPSFSVFL